METFDFIVVGAGSSGCALAYRLSEDPKIKVLLLEAGPSDWNPLIRLPVGEALTIGGSIDWQFQTEPEPALDNRQISLPRGKVLGGSSAINGQLYVRGHRKDFDEWESLGCKGWGYDGVLPYFIRSENWAGPPDQGRGTYGPLKTIHGRYRNPLFDAFIKSGSQLGYPVLEDYNLGNTEGFSWAQFTQEHAHAQRCSSAHAYLADVSRRKNLEVRTGCHVTSLSLSGHTCTGLSYNKQKRNHQVSAGEVILSAGAYQSPQILMLSGIGPAEHLRSVGLESRHDLPGVGQNLQDHFGGVLQARCTQRMTYHQYRNPLRFLHAAWQLYVHDKGPLSIFPMNAIGFVRTNEEETRPDLQFLFFPVATDMKDGSERFAAFNGYAIQWGVMRPKSRGSVTLRSGNPLDKPVILHNYLSHEQDIEVNNRGLEIARALNNSPAFDSFRGEEVDPGAHVASREAITDYNRKTMLIHYHPSGSCKMGEDQGAVVDSRLKVHGLKGLRVADASIMPTVTSGNTNAPSIMIGEKAADLALGG